MCYALEGDSQEKGGQIAHLDHDPSNNRLGNLAWLCLPHHDQYDSKSRQSRGYALAEVRRYRDMLYTHIAARLPGADASLDDAKETWRRLLAGELEVSVRSSRLHTIISKLRAAEARKFRAFCGMVWRDRRGEHYYQLVTQETDRYARDQHGLDYGAYRDLDRLGLIDSGPNVQVRLDEGKSILLVCHDRGYRFEAEKGPAAIHVRPLTADGQELMAVSGAEPDHGYLDTLFYTLPAGMDMCENAFNTPPHPLVPEIAEQVAKSRGKQVSELSEQDYAQTSEVSVCSDNDTSGLRRLTALTKLTLINGPLDDLADLCHMTKLEEVELEYGRIPDLAPLGLLPWLRRLGLHAGKGLPPGLGQLQQLRTLRIRLNMGGPCPDLAGIGELGSLETLVLAGGDLGDVGFLCRLRRLRSLCLNQTPLTDLSALAGLHSLEQLFLYQVPVADLSPLRASRQLVKLDISYTKVLDLAPLAGCPRLTELRARDTGVADVSPLAGLCGLQTLELPSTGVHDLAPLRNAGRLQKLNLSATPVSDLGPLAGLTQLTQLNVGRTPVSSGSPLSGLDHLVELDLAGTGIRDLTFLASLTALHVLRLASLTIESCPSLHGVPLATADLSQTELRSLDCLREHPSLRSLDLTETKADGVAALASLSGLRSLKLGTTISDLSLLSGLEALEDLELLGTPVSSLDALGALKNLKRLRLTRVPIDDVTPLSTLPGLASVTFTECPIPRSRLLPLRRALPKLTISAENWVDRGGK